LESLEIPGNGRQRFFARHGMGLFGSDHGNLLLCILLKPLKRAIESPENEQIRLW
jgi:hypothetical protein